MIESLLYRGRFFYNYLKLPVYNYLTSLYTIVIKKLLQLHTPIVSRKGKALPMAKEIRYTTLTLVISRGYSRPSVMRGPCFMFNIFNLFKVRTKIEYQVDEYINWKATKSSLSAQEHRKILDLFLASFKYKDIKEITLKQVEKFRIDTLQTKAVYSSMKAMQAVRCFLRYHSKHIDINPEAVQDNNIDLSLVTRSAIIITMTEKKLGRPPQIELIKKVKHLRDVQGLKFRTIAAEMNRGVSQIHVWYKYPLK